jgi:hypothetical protein
MENKSFLKKISPSGGRPGRKIFYRAVLMLTAAVLLFPGCGIFYKPAFRGRVTDAETGKPVAGAAVVAQYNKGAVIGGPAGPSSYTQGARETLTDENGEFRIPPYFALTPFCTEENTIFFIFKPGYGEQTTPPRCMWRVSDEDFFSEKMFGSLRKVKCFSRFQKPETTEITVTFGMVELSEAKTWEERREANMIIGISCSESECPLLDKMMKEEEQWLDQNQKTGITQPDADTVPLLIRQKGE